jgi:transposase-like protein
METTNKKECPECKSTNIIDTGDRRNNGGDLGPGGKYSEPIYLIYECNDCRKKFVYKE